jgi:hypothetical protein
MCRVQPVVIGIITLIPLLIDTWMLASPSQTTMNIGTTGYGCAVLTENAISKMRIRPLLVSIGMVRTIEKIDI